MTPNKIAWLAGLLEGEGSFVPGPPSSPNQPRIAIEMKDRDIIERVAAYFATSYIRARPAKGNWSEYFGVSIKGRKAIELMIKLRPLMGIRRQSQIDKAIASYTPREHGDNTRKLSKAQWESLIKRTKSESLSKLSKEFGVSRTRIRKVLSK